MTLMCSKRLLVILALVQIGQSYFITVSIPIYVGMLAVCSIKDFSEFWRFFLQIDAHDEECFYDRVKSGTKMGLIFEVAEGGALDIDVNISGIVSRSVRIGFYLNT